MCMKQDVERCWGRPHLPGLHHGGRALADVAQLDHQAGHELHSRLGGVQHGHPVQALQGPRPAGLRGRQPPEDDAGHAGVRGSAPCTRCVAKAGWLAVACRLFAPLLELCCNADLRVLSTLLRVQSQQACMDAAASVPCQPRRGRKMPLNAAWTAGCHDSAHSFTEQAEIQPASSVVKQPCHTSLTPDNARLSSGSERLCASQPRLTNNHNRQL